MTKREAVRTLKRIQENFFDGYYPLNAVMFDKEKTVGHVYKECVKTLAFKRNRVRRKPIKCNAKLWHGPGHQSCTTCQVTKKHKIHKARYGRYDQIVEWKGDEAFTDYFDNPKDL